MFIKDASVFVQYFGIAMAKSAPHVYLSALPFAPRHSLVSEHYSSSFSHTLHVKSGKLAHWPSLSMMISNAAGLVNSIAVSPDGQWITAGLGNGGICVWYASTGEVMVGPFTGHTAGVTSVGFSPDGQHIVSGSWDKTICVWNARTGELVADPFTGHTDGVASVRYSPDGQQIVSGSGDRTICVWNARTGEVVAGPFTGHTAGVTSVGFSSDGQQIVSGSWDKTICVWNARTGDAMAGPFTGHTRMVSSVGFSPDGQQIISGSFDQTIRLWNAMGGVMVIGPFSEDAHLIRSMRFSSDGQETYPSTDKSIHVLDAKPESLITLIQVNFTDQSVIEDDGWIHGNKGELLMWIPALHRTSLHRPSNVWVAGKNETCLNLSKFVHGHSWIRCINF